MSWWDDISSFVGDNFDWLGPTLDFAGNAFGSYNRGQTRGDYWDALEQQRQQEHADGQKTYNAYLDWLQQSRAASDANRAAGSRAAAARAAGAAQTERNRQRAASKAFKIRDKTFEEQLGLYKPYSDTGQRLLPQMEGATSKGIANLNMLSDYLNKPEQLQKLNQTKSANSVNLKLPKYLQGGK